VDRIIARVSFFTDYLLIQVVFIVRYSENITFSSLFGLLISSQKLILPAPYDKIQSVLIPITLLRLAFLVSGLIGPILTTLISGSLSTSMRGRLLMIIFSFTRLYGVLVSSFNFLFIDQINRLIGRRITNLKHH